MFWGVRVVLTLFLTSSTDQFGFSLENWDLTSLATFLSYLDYVILEARVLVINPSKAKIPPIDANISITVVNEICWTLNWYKSVLDEILNS